MMFASLVFERDLLGWDQMGPALRDWAQDVGGFAIVALVIWGLAYLIQRPAALGNQRSWLTAPFLVAVSGAGIGYVVFLLLCLFEGVKTVEVKTDTYIPPGQPKPVMADYNW